MLLGSEPRRNLEPSPILSYTTKKLCASVDNSRGAGQLMREAYLLNRSGQLLRNTRTVLVFYPRVFVCDLTVFVQVLSDVLVL